MKDTREYILKTSLALFLQKSYRDVTMSEIVKATGLSKGAFYHYFTSKEELFREITHIFFHMGSVDYTSLIRGTFREFYTGYVDYLDASISEINKMVPGSAEKSPNINFFLLMFDAATRFPDFLKWEQDIYEKDVQAWTNMIAEAMQRGEISGKGSAGSIARLFLYCNDGVFIRFINSGSSDKSFKELLLNAYDTIYDQLKN
jgi:TetR/AcrR family transcriptional regulator, transcriptional repressor for nem operon